MILPHIGALILAIGLTPWLLARAVTRHDDINATLSIWGPVMVALNILVPLTLHVAGIRVTANNLMFAHLVSALGAVILSGLNRRPPLAPGNLPSLLTASMIMFAVLVLPVSHIAGIDTYKWQDLAGNIAVENRLSWIIHPLSLFGYTPRSYPCAQPLILATIEILGHTGVDWGFYILSVALGLTGLFGAWRLGLHLFTSNRYASWFVFLYVFAPVFMRYNYWATGRGLLLALLPVYLLTLLQLPAASRPALFLRSVLAFVSMSALLAVSHKAGLVGAVLIPLCFLLSPLLTPFKGRAGILLLLIATAGAGFMLAGHSVPTLLYRDMTRFGILVPLAVLGFLGAPGAFSTPTGRRLLASGLATLILSCTPDMYGALLALPFITFAAVTGFTVLETMPRLHGNAFNRHPALRPSTLVFTATLLAAAAIVVNQATDSPSHSLYKAARFLEKIDPRGPFRIEAPGRARAQVQAYVSGCPRFTVESGGTAGMEIRPIPEWTGKPALAARRWIDYLRDVLDLRGANTDWYGSGDRVYIITVDGNPPPPPGTPLLYSHGNVKLYGPVNQSR